MKGRLFFCNKENVMTKKNFNLNLIISLVMIVFLGSVLAVPASAVEFNFNRMNLGTGVSSKRILNLKNLDSNINDRQAEQIMKNGFLANHTETFGFYTITLEANYVGPGPHDRFFDFTAGLGFFFTLGTGLLFVPTGESRYELAASIEFFDNNKKSIQKFRYCSFLNVKQRAFNEKDYTFKMESLYQDLLKKCQQDAHQVSDQINAGLTFSAMGAAIEAAFKELTANGKIPPASRIAILINPDHQNGSAITVELERLFIQTSRFQVLDRRNIEAVLRELEYQWTPFVDKSTAMEIGGHLGAQFLIFGDISGSDGNKFLTLQAISVHSSQIIAALPVKI
jgi:hypothetical protein